MAEGSSIRWPEQYAPAKCPVHVRNALDIAAPPEVIWAWLIRAQLWPSWYPNSANVRFISGPQPDLDLGTKFRWRTFGVTIDSTVMEFVPPERIAWDAHAAGINGYHAFLIQRTGSCHVVTEETQKGWLAQLNNVFRPNRMHQQHQIWLEALSRKAIGGMPPQV